MNSAANATRPSGLAAVEPAKISEVDREQHDLDQVLANVGDLASTLRARLGPVTRPIETTAKAIGRGDMPPDEPSCGSPVGRSLQASRYLAGSIHKLLADTLEALCV